MDGPFGKLGSRERTLTFPPMCEYLLELVRRICHTERVAVLWVDRRSFYWRYYPLVELWGKGRDVRRYNGPLPIIAHPLCGPWGKLSRWCKQSRLDGRVAMDLVEEFGGVVEQPLGSRLFKECGKRREIVRVNQGDYGFPTPKPTVLYLVPRLVSGEIVPLGSA